MKFKKGGLLDENLVGLILAVAMVFVLLVFMFNLFAPSFDKDDKTAESYFKTLSRAVETADSGGGGDFFMMDDGGSELTFYLVYFGDVASFENHNRNFARSKQGENVICVCYWKGGNVVCNYCENLKLPARCISIKKADEKNSQVTSVKINPWVIKEGQRIKIVKKEGHYEFTEI